MLRRSIVPSLILTLAGCQPCEGTVDPGVTAQDASPTAQPEQAPPTATVQADATPADPLPPPPTTATVQADEVYHGVTVADPYRWLENPADHEVEKWSAAQNAYARAQLDALPHLADIEDRVRTIYEAKIDKHWSLQRRGELTFAMKRQPPAQQPFLVVMQGSDPSTAKALVDPNQLATDGSLTIDWYRASPDGKILAVSMSKGGSEAGDLHFFDAQSGARVHESIEHVNGGTAGGSLAWAKDGKSVFYTRYPRADERPPEDANFYIQVYRHYLGRDPAKDRHELGKDFPRIAEVELTVDEASGRVLATVQNGDGGEFAHYLRDTGGRWQKFTEFGDRHVQAVFGPKNKLYVLSRNDAPKGKILETSARRPQLDKAKVIVPEGSDALVSSFWSSPSIVATKDRIFATYQLGGPTQIRAFGYDGSAKSAPQQLPISSVGGMQWNDAKGELWFSNGSYVHPGGYFAYDLATDVTKATALQQKSPVRLDDVEVRREFATSLDGTKVPLNILIKKGTKIDGKTPAVVTGYGGYGLSRTPRFSASNAVLLEQGVIYVVANIRGGSEYGERWHLDGNLTKKQNVFDDFAAVIAHLHKKGYTAADRTAIVGGSNGGLLMGATMVQNPGLVAAVVSHVGIYDMLRVELSANGAFNIPEFGTVENPEHFKALFAYSPYHNVVDGVNYPPVLFTTGANDPRVDPMQSRKMTARLQAATGGKTPVLLRTSATTGHGGSAPLSSRVAKSAHSYAFILHHLGVDYTPVRDQPVTVAQSKR